MNKKAQGLPITTIIIAILALLVLVVIILIFTGKVRVFGGELVSCEGKGGFCTSAKNCQFGYQTELKETDCKGDKPTCCLPVLPAPAGAPCTRDEHCTNKCGSGNKCT